MSQITVEFDNTLELSEIVVPIVSSSSAEAGEGYSDRGMLDKMQTSVFGIQVPLIQINSTVVDYDAVQFFSLKSEGVLPELTMIIEDRYEFISNIDKPKSDNEVRIQIIPRFDNAYKKVNLSFYITNISVSGKMVRLSCAYKMPKMTSSKFESLGQLDTYSLFKQSAQDTGLGFATNISQMTDNRYIYCDNKSWLDLLNEEIQFAAADTQILDWWIDLWNNINLVDIQERYNAIDSDEDMKIWIANQVNEVSTDETTDGVETVALIHNHPAQNHSELFVTDYSIQNTPGQHLSRGTDHMYSIYEDVNDEYLDYLIQDGDIQNDIFTKYEYLGEVIGEHNYLLQKELRKCFLQKISADSIKVTLQSPSLGLMRGHKVNFIRYVNDDKIENTMTNLEEAGLIDRNVDSNIPLSDFDLTGNDDNGRYIVDRTVSGQYLIQSVNIQYNDGWKYVLTLIRPTSEIPNIVNE